MDWGKDYFTFSDTNIEYIWQFLKIVNARGWLYLGHRPTEWCPRCGTSISAHELVGSYVDRDDPSLSVRFPLLDRPGEASSSGPRRRGRCPPTSPPPCGPKREYGRKENGDWIAVQRAPEARRSTEVLPGSALVGWRYEGPFDHLPPGGGVDHRVVGWDEVSMDEGTGIVHIAPGCGAEDFDLGKECGLAGADPGGRVRPVLPRVRLARGAVHGRGRRPDHHFAGRARAAGEGREITHRYPECWRCHTPLIFRDLR